MKMRLVSLLTSRQIYRQSRNEGYAEAQEIVRECEVGQLSSEICHKLGIFYSNLVVINEFVYYFSLKIEFIHLFLGS